MPSSAPGPSAFTDPWAVEAWDAWFRWRREGELRDLTVEASWERVASALAAVERGDAGQWRQRFFHAMADWHLLPDPRLLAAAGTGAADWPPNDLSATINLASFVHNAFTDWASFDREAFADCAGVAVRMLDDAMLLAGGPDQPPRLRIGLCGLADALYLLGIDYGHASGVEFARAAAALLAEASFAASVALAGERGASLPLDDSRRAQAIGRGFPPALVAAAERHGLRHAALTAIDSQPRLALFANGIADALDPLPAEGQWQTIDTPGGPRRIRACSWAQGLRRRHQLATGCRPRNGEAAPAVPGIAAQILVRARVAPWIDAPIDYPFRLAALPDPAREAEWSALAARYALPPPRWQERPEFGEG